MPFGIGHSYEWRQFCHHVLGRMPCEVERDNPDMTMADQFRELATWRIWNRMRAKAFDLGDDGDL